MSNRNTQVWHYDAEELGLKRAERVLQHFMPDVLASRDDVNPGVTGKHQIFRVPPVANFYKAHENLDRLLRGAGIGLQITAGTTSASSQKIKHSRNKEERAEIVRWRLEAALAFVAPPETWPYLLDLEVGRKETQKEATERIARKFKGVMASVLLKHIVGGAGIIGVSNAGGFGDSYQIDDATLQGKAVARVDVMQVTRIETPVHEVGP